MVSVGLYKNTYTAVLSDATGESRQPLSVDSRTIMSMRLLAHHAIAGGRVRGTASLRYAHLLGSHSSYLPAGELSATASVEYGIVRSAKHPLFVGSTVSIGSSQFPLLSDRSVDLHATWQLK